MSLLGVNLVSGGFGLGNARAVPGVNGVDYSYPSHSEIDYYASKGLNVFRLSFLWERLQHTQNGPLNSPDLSQIDDIVRYAGSKGIKVILDPHDFGQYYGNDIGSSSVLTSSFNDFWSKLAAHYANTPNVIFGLMNEPHDQTATQWASIANSAIDAIRGVGATSQEILVPGTYWDNAPDWTNTDNAATVGTQVHDPDHNMAFEVHCYFDASSGGIAAAAVSPTIGVQRITDVTRWAEATGNRLFLGEFGASTQEASLSAMNNMLTYMDQHTDVWQGATYWAGGPMLGNYMYTLEPTGLGTGTVVDQPQMAVLTQHL